MSVRGGEPDRPRSADDPGPLLRDPPPPPGWVDPLERSEETLEQDDRPASESGVDAADDAVEEEAAPAG